MNNTTVPWKCEITSKFIDTGLCWPGGYGRGKHGGEEILTCPDIKYLNWFINDPESTYLESPMWMRFKEKHTAEVKAIRLEVFRKSIPSKDYALSDSQEKSAKFIKDNLLNVITRQDHIAKLCGGAGYGKSYVMKTILRDSLDVGYFPAIMAPSRVATDNLKTGLFEFQALSMSTIASGLKLDKIYDEENVSYIWCSDSDSAVKMLLSDGNLLCIDEFSMVGDDVGTRLVAAAYKHKGLLLVIGDDHQLPPIGQATKSLFCDIPVSTTLTTPCVTPRTVTFTWSNKQHGLTRTRFHGRYSQTLTR